MRPYYCAVWNHDYTFGSADDAAELVGSTYVTAPNDREAAAQAYVHLVGRHRAQKLVEMGAPDKVIRIETDCLLLAPLLGRPIGPCGDRYYCFDNEVELWHLYVKRVSFARQSIIEQALRSSDRLRVFRTMMNYRYRVYGILPSRN